MKADTEEDCLKYAYIISKTYNRLLLVHYKDTFYQLQQNHYKFFLISGFLKRARMLSITSGNKVSTLQKWWIFGLSCVRRC